LFSLDKKYMMAATEQLLSDWLKEDIIVSHDVFDNVAFCLDKYVFKTKLK